MVYDDLCFICSHAASPKKLAPRHAILGRLRSSTFEKPRRTSRCAMVALQKAIIMNEAIEREAAGVLQKLCKDGPQLVKGLPLRAVDALVAKGLATFTKRASCIAATTTGYERYRSTVYFRATIR
jgi:hypothetical protein